jgi:hypothetical protein
MDVIRRAEGTHAKEEEVYAVLEGELLMLASCHHLQAGGVMQTVMAAHRVARVA